MQQEYVCYITAVLVTLFLYGAEDMSQVAEMEAFQVAFLSNVCCSGFIAIVYSKTVSDTGYKAEVY